MKKLPVVLTVNGKEYSLTVESNERLLDTLRQRLGLTGTKEGCGVGECGACSVILDGNLVNSCMVLTAQCDGSRVRPLKGSALLKNSIPYSRLSSIIMPCSAGFALLAC